MAQENYLWHERIHLFKQLERVPGARATAGIVYEAQVQYLLQQGRRLDLIPMMKLKNGQKKKTSGTGKRAPRPQWHSSHVHLRDTSLEISRRQASSQPVSVNIQPSETLEYMDDELESLKPNKTISGTSGTRLPICMTTYAMVLRSGML